MEDEYKPKHMAPAYACGVCLCNCYYCKKGHNSGDNTCVFGHASYCFTRRVGGLNPYQPKHMVLSRD